MAKLIECDFSGQAVDFLGEPLFTDKPDTVWSVALLRHILQVQTSGPTMKMVLWAGDLREKKALSLDSEDWKTLYDIIDKTQIGAVIKGPLMSIMQKAKDASEKVD